jgi:hypothetical protein
MQYDLDALNSRLADIQGEISHINQMKNGVTLGQKSQQPILKITTVPPAVDHPSTTTSCGTSTTTSPNSKAASLKITNRKSTDELNDTGAFFISFNNASVSGSDGNDQHTKHVNGDKTRTASHTQHATTVQQQQQQQQHINQLDEQLRNLILIDGFSNKDEDEMERRREHIITRQIQRKQELEHVRQRREEERMRIAEEERLKEEESIVKKQLEKTRKNAIFQAYLDKKRQIVEETGGVMGKPLRKQMKNSASQQRIQQQQQQHQQHHHQLQLQQNDFDFEMNERVIQQQQQQQASSSKSKSNGGALIHL